MRIKIFSSIVVSKYFLRFFIGGIFSFTALQLSAQLIAFPGAEGAGRFTSGGRGSATSPTTVYEVTNLTDNNTPGSLRYAVNQAVASRTIVFRVSGTIHLTSKLNIRANTTIAGQTAPGDGICIADYPTVISGDNVIVRYMRFRMGDKNQLLTSPAACGVPIAPFTPACMPLDGSGGDDALGNLGNKNIIIDHCTVSWSSDEALTVYRGDSVTMQWNLIAEPLNYSYHFETGDTDFEQHGYGGIWGSRNGSFHHNLIADARGRSPRFAGSSTYPPGTPGQENADFRNNVIYNWGSYSTNGGEGGNYNIVNNYYKYGPSTGTGSSVSIPVRGMIVQPSVSAALPYGKFYVAGNYVDGYPAITSNNWLGVSMASGTQADTTLAKANTEFAKAPVTTQTAQQAYIDVLQFAGASFARDTLDQRIITDVTNRTGKFIDVQGGFPHGTPYAQTMSAWPTLNSLPAPADNDHDGMPDAYETANSLNPNDATDRNGIAANGYSHLENYLNGLVAPVVAPPTPLLTVGASTLTFSQILGTPAMAQTFTVTGAYLTGNITLTPPPGYEISANAGTTWSANAITLTQASGMVANTTISIRLNATAAGSFAGNITVGSSGAATKNISLTGTSLLKPMIMVTQNLVPFSYTVGAEPQVQTYQVAGVNLTGNITVTPPAHFQVSANGGSTWQSTPLTLTRSGTTISPTTISLRLNVPVTGMFSGMLTQASSNADAVIITIIGNRRVKEEYTVYPVPATRTVFIAHPATTGQATLTVFTASGQKIAMYNTQPGTIETMIDVSKMRQGLYHIEFRQNEQVLMMKLIKN